MKTSLCWKAERVQIYQTLYQWQNAWLSLQISLGSCEMSVTASHFREHAAAAVCSKVYSCYQRRSHKSSAFLFFFMLGNHRWPADYPYKVPVARSVPLLWYEHVLKTNSNLIHHLLGQNISIYQHVCRYLTHLSFGDRENIWHIIISIE